MLKDRVGDGGGVAGCGDVMDAEDVGSGEDGGGVGCDGGVVAGVGRYVGGFGEEAFAGETGEDGELEERSCARLARRVKFSCAEFAEAEAGVEDDVFARRPATVAWAMLWARPARTSGRIRGARAVGGCARFGACRGRA